MTCDVQRKEKVSKKMSPATFPDEQPPLVHAVRTLSRTEYRRTTKTYKGCLVYIGRSCQMHKHDASTEV